MNLADALVPKSFESGSVIVKQGDPADGMYFIESGKAVVSMIGSDGTERTVRFGHLGPPAPGGLMNSRITRNMNRI